MLTPEQIEELARVLCEADGRDPDELEPGDDPYMNNTPVDDGRNRKGEICHFYWRKYVNDTQALAPIITRLTAEAHAAGVAEGIERAAALWNRHKYNGSFGEQLALALKVQPNGWQLCI